MPRVPRGLHSPAGAYAPGRLGWGPASPRPAQRIPMQLYRNRIAQVPLVGGQGQTTLSGWPTVTGTVTSGAAFQTIAQTAIIAAGVYTVAWSLTLSGTIGGADANNVRLVLNGATFLVESVNAGSPGTYPQTPFTVGVPAGSFLQITVGPTIPTTGAVYAATITGQGGSGLISVGPSGIGNVWYPASATILTTSGINDNSTCSIYLGPAGVPITLQATVFPGGTGTASLAIPSMTPGQYIIAQWTGGTAGDTASLNITGTMDSVSP